MMNSLIAQVNRNNNALPPSNANNTNSNPPQAQVVVPGQIKDPFGGKSLSAITNQVVLILLTLIVIVAVVVIIVAGFRMIAGGGDPAQIAKAKKAIIWAIIGIVVAFMSFAIVAIVQNLLQR